MHVPLSVEVQLIDSWSSPSPCRRLLSLCRLCRRLCRLNHRLHLASLLCAATFIPHVISFVNLTLLFLRFCLSFVFWFGVSLLSLVLVVVA